MRRIRHLMNRLLFLMIQVILFAKIQMLSLMNSYDSVSNDLEVSVSGCFNCKIFQKNDLPLGPEDQLLPYDSLYF